MIPCRVQFVPPHQVPCDSVQRRLLSIKMGVFMDRVCKNQLLSTEKAVFMDKAIKSRGLSTKTGVFVDKMEVFRLAGINRVETIYEVMSSHSARRAFSGNMYDKVQDPNLICALTGHKEDSRAFARYRKIDEDTNRKTISLLE